MKVLLVAEKPGLLPELAGFLKDLGSKLGGVEAIAFTAAPSLDEAKKFTTYGFAKTYVAVAEQAFPDQLAKAVVEIIDKEGPDLVVGVATKMGNEVVARIAGAKGMPMFTEIVDVEAGDGAVLFHRAVLGGRAISVLKPALPAAATIPARKYEAPQPGEPGEVVEVKLPPSALSLVKVEKKEKGGINIEEAEIVVGVGRGFRKKEDLAMAEELANLLGGAVGCSRPIAADYHWLPEDAWIGISGKKIRPKLYIAIGISGAPQHMSAVMDAKVIVAVNKDKNAPVFQYTDYGVVADLYQFLPVFIQKLKEKLGG